jgi:hypothetical protein
LANRYWKKKPQFAGKFLDIGEDLPRLPRFISDIGDKSAKNAL